MCPTLIYANFNAHKMIIGPVGRPISSPVEQATTKFNYRAAVERQTNWQPHKQDSKMLPSNVPNPWHAENIECLVINTGLGSRPIDTVCWAVMMDDQERWGTSLRLD